MLSTPIQWCDSTVNPTGFQCDGCELWIPSTPEGKRCYAGRWAERTGGLGAFDKPIELKPGRMAKAAAWPDLRGKKRDGKPWIPAELQRLIFIGDMADTISAGVPYDYLKTEIIDNVTSPAAPYLALAHQAPRTPEAIHSLAPGPSKGFPILARQLMARHKHHLAPQIGSSAAVNPVRMPNLATWNGCMKSLNSAPMPNLGNHVENDPVPCFVKQLGSRSVTHNAGDDISIRGEGEGAAAGRFLFRDKKGGDWTEWPDQLRVRQFPKL